MYICFDGEEVSLVTQPFRRPMRLTASELGALELGLAILRAERAPDELQVIDRALERLRKALVEVPEDMLHIPLDAVATAQRVASLPNAGAPEVLGAIQKAIAASRKLSLTYRGGGHAQA